MFVCHKFVSFFLFITSLFHPFFFFLFYYYILSFLGDEMIYSGCHSVFLCVFFSFSQYNSRHHPPVLNGDVIHTDLSWYLLCSLYSCFLPCSLPFYLPLSFLSKLQFSNEWDAGSNIRKVVS